MVKKPPRPQQYFSVRDAAAYTGVPYGTVKRDVYIDGRLPGVLIARTTVFTREQLDDYLARGRRTTLRPDRYNVDEAAAYLGVEPAVVEAAVDAGRLRPLVLAGNALFQRAQLDEFAARGTSDLTPAALPFYGRNEVAAYIALHAETGWDEPVEAVRGHIWDAENIPVEIVGRSAIVDHREVEAFIEALPVRETISDDDVRELYRLYHTEEGHTHRSLAEQFGISYVHAGRIINRESRADATAGIARELGLLDEEA